MNKILFIVCLLFSTIAYSQDDLILVKITDNRITGESTTPGFTDYIPVLALNFGISNTVTYGGGAGGGGTAGKAKLSDISFVHNGSKNSPFFNLYVASGKFFTDVEILILRNGGGKPNPIYRITLKNAIFTSVTTSSDNDCGTCAFGVENISMAYSSINWEDIASTNKTGWDIITNRAN